jgi:predicted P-loop ATPase
MTIPYGATQEEWIYFSLILGQTENLLPVVSNPYAEISSESDMKKVGKTPSIYNKQGKVAGIPEWTNFKATEGHVKKWRKKPDYGICLQTREIRALDIDIEDPEKAKIVTDYIKKNFNLTFPERFREKTGKTLLAFYLKGEYPKRTMKVDGGIIEFLGNGNQFVASGTHESGVRYQWKNQDSEVQMSSEQFEEFWYLLSDKFAIEIPTEAGKRKPKGENLNIIDPIVDKLEVLKKNKDGTLYITCPFKNEHTMDSGISETCYFPAGTRGYEQGHFKCLHAHCSGRSDNEFLDALGVIASHFELIPEPKESKKLFPSIFPGFDRKQSGVINATLNNIYVALKHPHFCGKQIGFDNFRYEVMLADPDKELAWRPISDMDYGYFKKRLEAERDFESKIPLDLLRLAVSMVADENQFDSAKIWIDSLQWDGIERVDRFMSDYMKSEPNAYARAVSRYIWSALAGRVIQPGVKADMVPIFEGDQGTIKSTTIESLSPHPDFFTTFSFDEDDANLARKIRGKLVAEIPELRGLHTKELESIKAFVTKTHEEWIPKFKEYTTKFPRRLLFFATTNLKEILADKTGHRRWLPIRTNYVDIAKIRQDRDQLWAEGKEIFNKYGVCYQEAELLSKEVHSDYEEHDPWEDHIVSWIYTKDSFDDTVPIEKGYITMEEVIRHALNIDTRNIKGMEARRVGGILRKMGFERKKKREGELMQWIWTKEEKQPGIDLV